MVDEVGHKWMIESWLKTFASKTFRDGGKKNSGGSNFCIKFVKLYQGGVLPEHFREVGGGSGSGSNDKWTSGDRNSPLLSDVLSRGRLSQIELTGGDSLVLMILIGWTPVVWIINSAGHGIIDSLRVVELLAAVHSDALLRDDDKG